MARDVSMDILLGPRGLKPEAAISDYFFFFKTFRNLTNDDSFH